MVGGVDVCEQTHVWPTLRLQQDMHLHFDQKKLDIADQTGKNQVVKFGVRILAREIMSEMASVA